MQKIKKICALILCLTFAVFMLSSCTVKGSSIHFYYPFGGEVNSFDPQIASTSDEFLIIENSFEGLVRVNDDNSVVPAAAERWEISSDGKTYTFYLRKGAKWHIGKSVKEKLGEDFSLDVTANDFVFALQRAVSPETEAPLYSTVSVIKNAPDIFKGKKDSSSLGVTAVDDYTLRIQLTDPDESFLNTLSTAVAMPCNEDFFNYTGGRYGLGLEHTISNGQFFVSNILDSSYLLDKNDDYNGENPAKISDLTFCIDKNEENIAEKLGTRYYDAAFINGTDSLRYGENSKITFTPYSDRTWCYLLNNNEIPNQNLRLGFCSALQNADISEMKFFTQANGIIPPSCTIGAESAPRALKSCVIPKDEAKAKAYWLKGLAETNISELELTIKTTKALEDVVKEMIQGVQKTIGQITAYTNTQSGTNKISFTLKIEILEKDELEEAVSNGDYQIAFYPLQATKSSPVAFLQELGEKNVVSFDSESFDKSLARAQNSTTVQSLSELCGKTQSDVVKTGSICPAYYEARYYASAKGVSGIQFHPGSGRVCFVNAERED